MSSMTTDGVMGYDGNKWYKLCSDGYENSESQIMGWWVMTATNDTSYVQTVMKTQSHKSCGDGLWWQQMIQAMFRRLWKLRVTNHGVMGYDGYKWYKLCSDGYENSESQIIGWWVMMATNDTSYVQTVIKLKSHKSWGDGLWWLQMIQVTLKWLWNSESQSWTFKCRNKESLVTIMNLQV